MSALTSILAGLDYDASVQAPGWELYDTAGIVSGGIGSSVFPDTVYFPSIASVGPGVDGAVSFTNNIPISNQYQYQAVNQAGQSYWRTRPSSGTAYTEWVRAEAGSPGPSTPLNGGVSYVGNTPQAAALRNALATLVGKPTSARSYNVLIWGTNISFPSNLPP